MDNLRGHIGQETNSLALVADGWHLRTDVYTSAGVMVAMILIAIGAVLFPAANFYWVDPAIAIFVVLLIIRVGYHLTREAVQGLLDKVLPDDEEKRIIGIVKKGYPAIKGFHQLRTRKVGKMRFAEFHIKVEQSLSIAAAHRIGEEIEKEIEAMFAGTDTTIHIEPCDDSCTPRCVAGFFITDNQRRIPKS